MQDTLLFSYWDINGDGINTSYIIAYSDKIIFDSYNRSFYADGKTFGNHFIGSYHGEVFNDFVNNSAYANYGSAHGYHTYVQNEAEAAFGKFNKSIKDKTLFSIGNGSSNKLENAFEIQNNGVAYVSKDIYVNNSSIIDSLSYLVNAYSYVLGYTNNLAVKYDTAYSYLSNAYSYTIGYVNSITAKYDTAYSYLINSYSYVLGYVDNLAIKYDTAYSYLINAYSYTLNNCTNTIPNTNYSKLFIWTGTIDELPSEIERYRNVLYIVTEEPENQLPELK